MDRVGKRYDGMVCVHIARDGTQVSSYLFFFFFLV